MPASEREACMSNQGEHRPAPERSERFRMLKLLRWRLQTGNPAATIDRLFVSKHVEDLQFIVSVTLTLTCVISACLLVYAIASTSNVAGSVANTTSTTTTEGSVANTTSTTTTYIGGGGSAGKDGATTGIGGQDDGTTGGPGGAASLPKVLAFLPKVLAFLAAFIGLLATVIAVVGAICAWAYKVGSARLGVVDLFACEISTLCRVTLVTDAVGRFIDRIERQEKTNSEYTTKLNPEVLRPSEQTNNARPPPALVRQFTSAENYFPVFEGNSRDLESLEARVVINITSFYTYMKTVRDLMRSAAALKPQPVALETNKADQLDADTWRDDMRNMIYMLFLGLEAGRDSIEDLVEFVPEQVERTIVVLLSELKAYLFLLQEFPAREMHSRRLNLRWDKYRELVPKLTDQVERGLEDAKARLTKAQAEHGPRTKISLRQLGQNLA
jgi:hypothetical protein